MMWTRPSAVPGSGRQPTAITSACRPSPALTRRTPCTCWPGFCPRSIRRSGTVCWSRATSRGSLSSIRSQLRVLLLAGSGFHERIELREPLDVALDQQTVPDLRIDRGQKPGQHVQGVRLVRAGEGLHAEVIAVG